MITAVASMVSAPVLGAVVAQNVFFYLIAAVMVIAALRVVTTSNIVHAALYLVVVLAGVAAQFLLLGAEFVGVTQVLVYIGAVIATKLFADAFPQWFGSLGASAYTLFQIMTLESWSMGIVRPVMEVYPYAWAFFLPFILVTTFAVVNLLVGLVVNSMQDAHHTEDVANTDAYRDDVKARLDAIDKKLDALGGERKG